MEKIKFTKTALKEITPSTAERRFSDIEQPGLILRVLPSGHKSFCLQRKVNGRTTRVSIGAFPDLPIEQARLKARELLNKVISGESISDRGKTITVDDLLDRFEKNFRVLIASGDRRERSLEAILRNYRLHLKASIGSRNITQIDNKIAGVIVEGLKQKSPSVYNRGLIICKSLFNFAISNELCADNPFDRYSKLSEKIRERFLQPDEMTRFFESVMLEPQIYRDVVLVTLFTGQRKTCILSMEWREIDFTNGLWHIPITKMKGKRPHTVPLIADIMEILKQRKAAAKPTDRFVFPSDISKTGHIAEKTSKGGFWRRIITRAGLYSENKDENLCVHDLRRTLGSWQAMGNESLLVISKVLGHKDIKITASVYAHLQTGGARGGIESAASAMLLASKPSVEPKTDDRIKSLISELDEAGKQRLLLALLGDQDA